MALLKNAFLILIWLCLNVYIQMYLKLNLTNSISSKNLSVGTTELCCTKKVNKRNEVYQQKGNYCKVAWDTP